MNYKDLTKEQLLKKLNAQQEKIKKLEKKVAVQGQTEESLKTSEKTLSVILEKNADGIIIVDMDGTVLYVNPAAEKLFGKSKKDFIGYSFGFPISTDNEENFLTIRKGKTFCDVELRVVQVHWLKRPAFQLSVRDITERKKAESILQEKEYVLSQSQRLGHIGSWGWDLKGPTIWTDEMYNVYGVTPETFKPTFESLINLIHPDDRQAMQQWFESCTAGRSPAALEFRTILPDGSIRFIRGHGDLLTDNDGKPIYMGGTAQDITERKKAESELKFKNVILNTQLETSIDGILAVDENGKIMSFNKRFIALWDIPADVMESKSDKLTLKSIFDKIADPDRFLEKVNYLYEHQKETSFDEIFLSDGRIFDRYSAPMTGLDGKYYGRIWFFRDITKRKLAEERINFQAHLLSIVGQAVIATGPKLNINYWNNAAIELYGWTEEEAIGRNIKDVIISQSTKEQSDEIMGALKSGNSFSGEFFVQKKDGTLFPVHVSVSPILDEAGSLIGIITVSFDITDQKISEEALVKSEEKFRSIMENSADAIFITDQNGKYVFTNKAVTEMLGFTADEMKSKTVIDMAPKERINEYVEIFKNVLITGKGVGELELLKSDGSYISTDLNSVIMPDGMLYGSCRDITERVKAKNELTRYKDHLEALVKERTEELEKAKVHAEEANTAKSRFLANMSHEIRTPLNAVLGFSQLMIRDPFLSEKQKERLIIINRSGENLLSLINDILEISKIEAGKVKINTSVFDLFTLLDDIEIMFRINTDEKKLTFILERSKDIPRYINTDETKLRQILINLIGNAIKFTLTGGISVKVRIEQNEDVFLTVEVEDSGTGISKNDIERLFKIFEQTADGSKMGGTGLGLALSKHFAQQLGGDISVWSDVNKGSTFCLKINILLAENSDFKETVEKKFITGLKPKQKQFKLLVVDDKFENRLYLSELLSEFGFIVIEAVNGQDSINKFKENQPDLILMDINMPGMRGNEAIMEIRNLDNGKIVPIIAVTASVFEEDKQKILKTGINGFIRKPFRDYEIFDILKSTLGVEYLYKADETEKKYTIPEIKKILKKLPEELADQIIESAKKAEIKNLIDHINESAKIIPEIVPYLQLLAKEYKYDLLINLLLNRKNNNE